MSSGHHSAPSPSARDLSSILSDPRVWSHVMLAASVDRSHDLPYLGGYSQDGRTVYIDRHLPDVLTIDGNPVHVIPLIATHERVEKAVMDVLGYDYPDAHHVATQAEHQLVRLAGLDPTSYEDTLRPYIKAARLEQLTAVPRDLDLTPYRDEHDAALLDKMRKARSNA